MEIGTYVVLEILFFFNSKNCQDWLIFDKVRAKIKVAPFYGSRCGDDENARPENDVQKLRGLENAGLENDGRTFIKL